MSGKCEIRDSKSTVIWKIEDFCKCNAKFTDSLISPTFSIHEMKGNIYMKKEVEPQSNTKYIGMFLHMKELRNNINVSFVFSILTKENEVFKLKGRKEFTTPSHIWGFSHYLRSTSPILANGQLTIQCKISVDQNEIQDKQSLTTETNLTESFNFEKFLFSELLSDVQLIVGEEVLYAHKFILVARSDVFAAMFTHEMKESMENKVKIEDVDCKVVKEMLRYIYTQKVDKIDETITEDLLAVADKYLLNELKSICEKNLIKKLSNDNFVNCLVTADKCKLNDLKKETVQFIAFNSDDIIDDINLGEPSDTLKIQTNVIFENR